MEAWGLLVLTFYRFWQPGISKTVLTGPDRQPLTHSFAGTTIINNHRQGGLRSGNLFKPLTLLETRSPRSRCQWGGFLRLRPPSLSCRCLPSSAVFLYLSMCLSYRISSHKATSHITLGPTLMALFWPNYFFEKIFLIF